jgi:hypothetical protein
LNGIGDKKARGESARSSLRLSGAEEVGKSMTEQTVLAVVETTLEGEPGGAERGRRIFLICERKSKSIAFFLTKLIRSW